MEQLVKKLPIGIQDFEKVRRENYLYIDKTERFEQLVQDGCYYFLSRPRRFGKSLLLSTIKAYFEGKRELFDGLALSKKEVEWVARPVLYLDLNTNAYDDKSVLVDKLDDSLSKWEQEYGLESKDLPLGMRFEKVIDTRRLDIGWLFSLMSMTSRCCRRLAIRNCKKIFEVR